MVEKTECKSSIFDIAVEKQIKENASRYIVVENCSDYIPSLPDTISDEEINIIINELRG